MKNAPQDLLAGFLKYNIYQDYSAEILFSQISSYVKQGFMTFDDYNSFMFRIDEMLRSEEIFTKAFYQEESFIESLKEKFNTTGFLKVYKNACSGMDNAEVLAEFFIDVFYIFDFSEK